MNQDDLDQRLAGVAALGDPVRRALYRYVVAQPQAVSRNQAAEGAGVARHVAKFHLDKLADDGLLEVDYARPPGRRGPGAGRPAKRYRRAARELAVSLPERRYDLAGRLLAAAVTRSQRDGVPVNDALRQAAREVGRAIGTQVQERAGSRPSRATVLAAARDVLDEHGYEPRADGHGLTLINCPFHALAQEYTELVCGMNLDLMRGLVAVLDSSGLTAVLQPTPGRCCVQLRGPVGLVAPAAE
ncbi:MAG: helix-turn-helix transcriptional regulator [Egibacteraceae bacterium]